MSEITIRQVRPGDMAEIAQLAAQLWPAHTQEALRDELSALADTVFFMALAGETAVGFVQCALRRDYVEGSSSSPVGYIEGLYVLPAYRQRGCAARLVAQAGQWAARQGCTELGSDCAPDNRDSIAFHAAAGFEEVGRTVNFLKKI